MTPMLPSFFLWLTAMFSFHLALWQMLQKIDWPTSERDQYSFGDILEKNVSEGKYFPMPSPENGTELYFYFRELMENDRED